MPGVFKLTGCSTRLIAWARTFDMCHSVSQSPQTGAAVRKTTEAAGRRTATTFSVFSPPPATSQIESASHVNNSDDSDSQDEDDEVFHGERSHYADLEVLQTDPKDAALFPWLIRVKVMTLASCAVYVGITSKELGQQHLVYLKTFSSRNDTQSLHPTRDMKLVLWEQSNFQKSEVFSTTRQ